jgi:regulator of RNase E activity RraA
MPVPCVVHPPGPAPSKDVVTRFGALSTSLVSDSFGRWAGAPGIMPVAGLSAGQVVVGPALTVRTRPGDNLVVHKAVDLARPGEVLVVAAGGGTDRAILGGLLGAYAATKGLVALIVDGAVRDVTELGAAAPPVFATGVCHLGPYKDGPGEIRGPVSIAGLTVHDGDLVVADEDGVAVVPAAMALEVAAGAEQKARSEESERAAIAAGTWDRSWLDSALELRPPS